MEKCNTYLPCVNTKNASTIQDEKWDDAMSYFKSEQYQKVVPTIIEYINADFTKYKTSNGYSIPHGSVVVNISLTDTTFKVECPFVHIKDAKKVPLMRKLAELRLNPLDLTNITLRNDDAIFEYQCPVELCEPYKIYDVLKEICLFADMYDDEMIEKFDATSIQEPKIEPFAQSLKEEVHTKVQQLIDEGIARLDYYMSKRNGRGAWCTLNITLKQLEFYAQPQGFLRTEIERAIDLIYDRDINFHDLLLKSKDNLLKIRNYNKEKFFDSLYGIEVFVPYKYSGKKDNIRENWSESYDSIKEMITNNNHEGACTEMLSMFYNLFYYNLVNEEISQPLMNAMAVASGQSWSEASESLLKGMKSIMEDSLDTESFGMDISEAMKEQMKNSMSMIQNIMKGFSK